MLITTHYETENLKPLSGKCFIGLWKRPLHTEQKTSTLFGCTWRQAEASTLNWGTWNMVSGLHSLSLCDLNSILLSNQIDIQQDPVVCQSVWDNQTTYDLPEKEESIDIEEMKRNALRWIQQSKRTLLQNGRDLYVLNGQSAGKSTEGPEFILLCYSQWFNLH